MSRYAAAVFREGRINLEPDWNTERRPNEDLKSAYRVSAKSPLIVEHLANWWSQYSLWATMPVLNPLPITSQGDALWSGSVIEMTTLNPESAPLPSALLLGIHSRFCNSLKALEVDCEMVAKASLRMNTQWLSRMRQPCFAQVFPWARRLWSTSHGKAVFGFTVCSFA